MKNLIAAIAIALTLAVPAFADSPNDCAARGGNWSKWKAKCDVPKSAKQEGVPEHIAEYKVGALQSTESISTGDFTSCDHGCLTQSTGHNTHYVVTADGLYGISAPTSAGLSFLQGALVSPNLPSVHIQWFLDDLHVGDKVLFAAGCDKHNNCNFWLPKPDQEGKEYHTTGWFKPRVAKTNTNQLCGTGKLSADVEAQVCNQPTNSVPEQTPAAKPNTVPDTSTSAVDAQIASTIPVMSCGTLAPQIRLFQSKKDAYPLTWTAIQSHCPTESGVPDVAPDTPPTPAEQAQQAQQHADCLKLAVNNPSIHCD